MNSRIAATLCVLCGLSAWARAAPLPDTALKSAQRHYLRGTLHEHRGDYVAAMQEYEAALSYDPNSAYICKEAADLALDMGDIDAAKKLARRLLTIDGKSAEAYMLIGRTHWASDELDSAQEAFETALKLAPQSSETILSLGALLSEHSPQKARELLIRFVKERPAEAAEAHYQLAKIDFADGHAAAAIGHIKEGISLEPDSLPLRYALAQAYEAQFSTDAALGEYLEILKLEPANVSIINHIGDIYFRKGQMDEARARFEEAHRLKPEDIFSGQWLAADAERLGDWSRAAACIQNGAILAEDPSLNLRLSYYQSQAGKIKEAVATLAAAHARWPAHDQIAYFLALGYDDLHQEDKAIMMLRRVLELKPDSRDARYQLGAIYEKTNRMPEAEKEFRQLVAAHPEDSSALNYLGYSLADRGIKLQEAEALIREAVRLNPANGAYLDSLGWVLFKQGRSTGAVDELLLALERSPDDETILEHLGDAYSALGSTAAAWRAWKRSEMLADASSLAGKKAAKAQSYFDAAELGVQYLGHLDEAHGSATKLSALCRIEGKAANRPFSYNGMLTFRGPQELVLDLLGPLFAPMFRIRLSADGFIMDTLHVEGLSPDALTEAVYGMFSTMREFLSGKLFTHNPARFRKGWRRRFVEVGDWRLELDAQGMRLAALEPNQGPGRVLLEDYVRMGTHWLPRRFTISGRGYTLSIQFEQVKAEFKTK